MKLDPNDELWSRCVKLRDGYKCRYCGRLGKLRGMHAHHFVGRRYRNTRWVVDNGICLCFACHNVMQDFPLVNKDFFIKTVGSDRAEELEILARTIKKVDKNLISLSLKRKLDCWRGNEWEV